ncbi:ATP-binding protein [Nocardioides sp. SYSU DS0663]|uniref:ATP-binding protein n=1 Tax=Nocardioides sp. SYSU DS0663 TaxID=3416445 RepID=UPI003F4BF340
MHGEVGRSPARIEHSDASGGPLARLADAVRAAHDVDEIAVATLGVVADLPGVCRVALALSEGGGRRLRFVDSLRVEQDPEVEWCHIDAYDDVPLTTVVRSGEVVHGSLESFGDRYAALVKVQRELGVGALAALPLPGTGSPIGGLLVYAGADHEFSASQLELLEGAARRASDAIRRVRLVSGRQGSDAVPEEPVIPEGALTTSVLLEGDPRATAAARRFLRQHLQAWGVPDDAIGDAQLCLSELVTNAVVHAGTASELRVVLDAGLLTVTVRDLGGLGRPARDEPKPSGDTDPLRVYGRGLQLVDALSDRWGSERDVTGTTVWFALELGEGSAPA